MKPIKRIALVFLIPFFAVAAGVIWYAASTRFVTTNNAYIKSEIIVISPDIDGRVVAVHMADHSFVNRGDLLFSLDARPYKIQLEKAGAKLKSVSLRIDSMRAEYAQYIAHEAEVTKRVTYLKTEFERHRDLADKGIGVKADFDEAKHKWEKAAQDLLIAKQKSRRALAALGGDSRTPTERHPLYLEALSEVKEAELNLTYTDIRAQSDGVVSKMNLQPGEWVEQGDPVFYLVGVDKVWIEANLKETQLTRVEAGQSVETVIDAYPDRIFYGSISRIGSAAGSEFMVLPAQNATGNWIKVVQRIPVRIELESVDDMPVLRSGMTVKVSIDTVHEKNLISDIRNLAAMLVK